MTAERPFFRVAQITDIHVFAHADYRPQYIFSKRLLGGLNEFLIRRQGHGLDVVDAAWRAVGRIAPDHLLVTGDLSSLATEAEFGRFRHMLESLPLPAEQITVIPGNHDAYVPGVFKRQRFERLFARYQTSDASYDQDRAYPIVRQRGPMALIALTTAHPSPPFMAVGTVGPEQRRELESLLLAEPLQGMFRLVALHHHPQLGVGKVHNRLVDAPEVRELLGRAGAELVVHGHLHKALVGEIEGPRAPIPVRGTAALSSRREDPLRRAQIRVFDIERNGGGVRPGFTESSWRYDPTAATFLPADG